MYLCAINTLIKNDPRPFMRHPFICQKTQTILLIIDEQAGLSPVISEFAEVVNNTEKLLKGASLFDIPVVFTEQNPEKLGATDPSLAHFMATSCNIEKIHFSACLESNFIESLSRFNRPQIVVAGTEAHVCVLQTCLDLLAADFKLFIVDDAIASRNSHHKNIATKQLTQAGAIITCTESVLFQWLEKAGTEQFRALLPLIK